MSLRPDVKKVAVYTKRLPFKKAGTGKETIDDDIIKEKQRVVLNSIAFEDENSLLDYVRIGKMSAGAFHIWEEQKNVAAAEVVFTTAEHVLEAGEKFRCEIKGGAANDICTVYLDGWMEFLGS